MSDHHGPPGGPATEAEFRDALIALIRAAAANGVSVDGGWMDRNDRADIDDRGIEIHTLANPVSDPVEIPR